MKQLLILILFLNFSLLADDYLVIHGLNTNQLMLDDLVETIENSGHKAHRLILSGHNKEDWNAFEKADKLRWEQDFIDAYQELGERKHLVAYSLGALVSMYASSKHKEISFISSSLFAPAISTRWYVSALKPLSWIGIKKIKSQVPESERVHSHTPMPAYMAIFEMQDWLTDTKVKHLNFGTTTVLMDERDKLVSYSGVQKWVKRNEYSWNFETLKSSRSAHHMVLNKKYLDNESWQLVLKNLKL